VHLEGAGLAVVANVLFVDGRAIEGEASGCKACVLERIAETFLELFRLKVLASSFDCLK